ncbi:DNA glycosylase, partial [Westerdykella ornata]
LQESGYGLIQERIRGSLFALVVQAILWNQTRGKAGRPVLFELLTLYPTPEKLAQADPHNLLPVIGKLGLQKIRSERLVKMAKVWVRSPPHPSRRYGKRNYPQKGDNIDTRDGELLDVDDIRSGWEIAHLPGVGAYALDSYRIFYRDTLRGIEPGDGHEPEWKRVLPLDKDLRPYLVWKWAQEGWNWDPITGHRERVKVG